MPKQERGGIGPKIARRCMCMKVFRVLSIAGNVAKYCKDTQLTRRRAIPI